MSSVTRYIGGWEWVCVIPGEKWSVSSGQFLLRTPRGWSLIDPETGDEIHVTENRNLRPAMLAAAPLLAFDVTERKSRALARTSETPTKE